MLFCNVWAQNKLRWVDMPLNQPVPFVILLENNREIHESIFIEAIKCNWNEMRKKPQKKKKPTKKKKKSNEKQNKKQSLPLKWSAFF